MSSTVRAVAALAALVVVVSCSSDDAGTLGEGDREFTTVPPQTVPDATTVPSTSAPEETDPSAGDDVIPAPDDEPGKPDPARTAGAVDAPAGVQPDGFTTVTARVTSAAGDVCEICLWLADTAEERNRGLMGVTDLGEPVGMLFRFEEPRDGNFWMFGTPMPLSIGWFGADGALVGEADMEPCLTDDSSTCERYGPGAGYLHALEMVQGELDVVGIGPGATLEVLAESPTCPT